MPQSPAFRLLGNWRAEFELYRPLLPLLGVNRYVLACIVLLSLVASGLEGFGFALFIPLIEVVAGGGKAVGPFPGVLDALQSRLPAGWHVPLIAGFIVAAIALKNALGYMNAGMCSYLNGRAAARLRSRLYAAILSASFESLDKAGLGRIANALLTETWRNSRALDIVFACIVDACAVLVLGGMLILISWQMTLLLVPVLCVIGVLVLTLTRSARHIGEKALERNIAFGSRAWDGLAGLRTVRAFGREAYELAEFDRASEGVRRIFFRQSLLEGLSLPLFEIFISMVLAGVVIGMSALGYSFSVLVVFVLVLYRVYPRVRQLISARVALLGLNTSVSETHQMLEEFTRTSMRSGPRRFTGIQREIALEDVSYSYPRAQKPALSGVCARFSKGDTIAIVGRSGAGKSTLIQIICRLIDPTTGTVRVDGIPLPELDLEQYRVRLAIVSQDIYLFSATVRHNIAYGRLDASDEEIVEAARRAHAHEFICGLPQGYATPIGDRGVGLSGGQRQRIALARAMLRKPDILVLDEATNALDVYAETLVQEALNELRGQCTVFIVAHRFTTIQRSDRVLVMDEGVIVEEGRLEALLHSEGPFASMYRLQRRAPAGLTEQSG